MKVIYSKKHYDWLVAAGLWPSVHTLGLRPRDHIRGTVLGNKDGILTVDWGKNTIYRERLLNGNWALMDQISFRHFADNLEILDDPA